MVFIRWWAIFLACITLICLFPSKAQAAASYAQGQIIVKYKDGNAPDQLQILVMQRQQQGSKLFITGVERVLERITLGLHGDKPPEDKLNELQSTDQDAGVTTSKVFANSPTKKDKVNLQNIRLLKTKGKYSVDALIAKYKALPEISYAEKNIVVKTRFSVNDTYYSQMWNLAKMDMANAWDIATGSSSITVAVVDTGIDYTHPDIPPVIKGPNYITGTMLPLDDYGHGTHVAGTIGAITNNALGVSGINQAVSLMAIKALDSSGVGYLSDVASGINYATANGAKVINLSIGSSGSCPQSFQDAIDNAYQNNVVVVAAAGNDGVDIDTTPDTPASCNHLISVGATGPNDERAFYSNYGSSVTIAAPGGDSNICGTIACEIESTWLSSGYSLLQGTSMATAHVSGLAALMLSRNPSMSPDTVRSIMTSSADTISTDQPIGKRINAYKALQAVTTRISNLTVTTATNSATFTYDTPEASTSGNIDYGWENNYGSTSGSFDTSPLTTSHSKTLTSLAPCETFHYKITTTDFWNIQSSTSDNIFTTNGCLTPATIIDTSNRTLATSSGGLVSLLNSGLGLSISAPINFATADANFQIKQLTPSQALATTSTPSQYSLVSGYIYEVKSFTDFSTVNSNFLKPITISVQYGSADTSSYIESSFVLYGYDSGKWTKLDNCSTDVNAKVISCTTQNFSIFGLFGTQVSPTATPGPTSTACSNAPPSNAPNIFQINVTNTAASVYFSPVTANLTSYVINYGLSSSANDYAATFAQSPSTGVMSYTVNELSPNTPYYFMVRGSNGCMPGPSGNTMKATTSSVGTTTIIYYVNGTSKTTSTASGSAELTINNPLVIPTSIPGSNNLPTSFSGGDGLMSLAGDNSSTESAGSKLKKMPPTGNETTVKVGVAGIVLTIIGVGALLAL